jgi:hypothetical protein
MTKLPTGIAVISAAMLSMFVFLFQVQQRTEASMPPASVNSALIPEALSPATSIYTQSQTLIGIALDAYGDSVAISGDYAVVGAPSHDGEGAAYVYKRDGETWTLQATLNGPASGADDQFGFSVDISGDTIVVGAPRKDVVVNGTLLSNRGAVYVYSRSGSTWSLLSTLTDSAGWVGDPELANEQFGYSVAIDGNSIVAGSPEDKTETNVFSRDNGSITIFEYSSPLGWTRGLKSSPKIPSGSGNAWFGRRVAISGSKVIVGADGCTPSDRVNAPTPDESQFPFRCTPSTQGAAAIYTRILSTWGFTTYTTNGVSSGSSFGSSVGIDDTTAVIGAVSLDKAYVSLYNGSSWSSPIELTGGTNRDSFGYRVAVDGDMLVVTNSNTGNDPRGRAYVYRYASGAWTIKTEIFQKHLSPSVADGLGRGVGIDGNRIILGATGTAPIFQNIGPRPFDFLNDASSDVAVFRPSTGTWYHTNPGVGGSSQLTYGTSGDLIAPADYDGDGKTDFAVYRPSTGVWYARQSSDGQSIIYAIGASGDYPIPNDFDNDGKADIAVFTASTGVWQWRRSSDGQLDYAPIGFGQTGDVPIMADFDGDGRGELAIFRSTAGGACPSNPSFWYYNLATSTTSAACFGSSGDKPAVGDFDGDGKTDISIYRSSNNTWWRLNSSNAATISVTFGSSGDIPTVADYDGDGESDVAVFRPSTNVWYIINSGWYDNANGSQYTIQGFGSSGDLPVPAAYNY